MGLGETMPSGESERAEREEREGGREMVGRWWKMREGMVAETEVMYEAVSSAR